MNRLKQFCKNSKFCKDIREFRTLQSKTFAKNKNFVKPALPVHKGPMVSVLSKSGVQKSLISVFLTHFLAKTFMVSDLPENLGQST